MSNRRLFFATALVAALLVALHPALALAAKGAQSSLEAQLGVRLTTTPPANARIGSTFDGIVVDPAKLSGKGLPGLIKNDRLLLKIVGPNNEFEILKSGAPTGKRFKFNLQGGIEPSDSPAAHAPVAAPAVRQ